jgi:hypothetical protein
VRASKVIDKVQAAGLPDHDSKSIMVFDTESAIVTGG